MTTARESVPDIDRGRGLADTPFLVDDGYNPHRQSPVFGLWRMILITFG
jgi:hypothetical protein